MKNVQEMVAAIQNLHARVTKLETGIIAHKKIIDELTKEIELLEATPPKVSDESGELGDGEEYIG
jgi:prefoldin subunit 5